MSLKVWLPLTGDIRNQGLTTGTINWTTAASFTNNGKLGKALSTGGCTMPASMTSQVLNNTAVSIACWLYVNADADDTTNRAMIFGNDTMSSLGGRQFSIFRYPNSDDIHLSWQSAANGSTVVGGVWSGVLTPHAWNHVCITYQNPNVKIYVNGVQVGSTSGVMNASSFAYDTDIIHSSSSHYINDFRIYDHCLSPMEVKELAKGLVLHYPLNRGGWGQENLWRNSSCQNDLDNMGQSTNKFIITTKDGYKCAHLSGQLNTTGYLSIPDTMLPTAGDWYTISADMRIDNYSAGSTNPYVGIYFGGDYLNTDNTGGWYGGSSYSGDGKAEEGTFVNTYNNKGWHRVTCTVQYLHGGSEYKKGAFRLGYIYARDFTGDLYVKNIKFEKGSIATPWCPNSSDALATTMGLNGTTEYDCSGYCNNGTRTGTFSWTSNTPKYQVSTFFEQGVDSYIVTPAITFDGKGFTGSYWFKSSSIGKSNYQMPLSTGSNYEMSISPDGKLRGGIYINGTRYVYNAGDSNYLDGKWHMFTMTYNGTTICRYVDGVLKHSETISGTSNTAPNVFAIGRHGASNTTYGSINLYESDVRIYVTALSADDVKSLYQNSAYIDSSGNVYGAVHSEV